MAGIGSSKLKVTIRESITLNNNKYDSLITKEIANINEVSKRIVTVPGDQSKRELLNVSGSIGAGSYLTSDVQYMRFTNLENEATGTGEGTLDLIFKNSNNDEFTVEVMILGAGDVSNSAELDLWTEANNSSDTDGDGCRDGNTSVNIGGTAMRVLLHPDHTAANQNSYILVRIKVGPNFDGKIDKIELSNFL